MDGNRHSQLRLLEAMQASFDKILLILCYESQSGTCPSHLLILYTEKLLL